MDRTTLESILDRELLLFNRMEGSLHDLIAATKKKDAEAIGRITEILNMSHLEAQNLDRDLLVAVDGFAAKEGIKRSEFRFSKLPQSEGLTSKVDGLRTRVEAVARLSNQAAGVLTANIGVIEDTIKVLEGLDSRSVGYGSDKSAPKRPSKLIDRTA